MKLNRFKNNNSVDMDAYQPIYFKSSNKEILETEISRIISQNDIYNDERNNSDKYRVSLNIVPLITNILSNTWGEDSLETFNSENFKSILNPINSSFNVKDNLSYLTSLYTHLKHNDGWNGYYKPEGLSLNSNFVELNPKKTDLTLIDDDDVDNWLFGLYYLNSTKKLYKHDGLPVTSYTRINYGGNISMLSILTSFNHNLKIGDKVYLDGLNNLNGEYVVMDLGDENNEQKNIRVILDIKEDFTINENVNIKKIINGTPSTYYARTLKRIPTKTTNKRNDYKLVEAGFSSNYYGESIGNLIYTEDIDVKDLRDHLNRPIIEIINVCFKNVLDKNKTNFFTSINSAWDLEYSGLYNNKIPDISKINEINYNYSIDQNLNINSDNFIYDFCEFNTYNLEEISLNKVNFRFNTLNRQTSHSVFDKSIEIPLGPRPEGYKYNPFYSFKIRNMSDYVETGNEYDEIPYHAIQINEKLYKWKDIIDKSADPENNIPFLNGFHYVNGQYFLLQKRQDPFNKSGLYYGKFPADKYGETNKLLPSEIKINEITDEC